MWRSSRCPTCPGQLLTGHMVRCKTPNPEGPCTCAARGSRRPYALGMLSVRPSCAGRSGVAAVMNTLCTVLPAARGKAGSAQAFVRQPWYATAACVHQGSSVRLAPLELLSHPLCTQEAKSGCFQACCRFCWDPAASAAEALCFAHQK